MCYLGALTMGDFEICNLKCSVKVQLSTSFEALQIKSHIKSWECKSYNSYIVIKPGQSLRFIVFKSKCHSLNTHINLTGVRTFLLLEPALELLCGFLEISQEVLKVSVDNISGKSNKLVSLLNEYLPMKNINLYSLLREVKNLNAEENIDLRFQPDSFSALIVRNHCTTLLVYPTAKLVVIASKDTSKIRDLIEKLRKTFL